MSFFMLLRYIEKKSLVYADQTKLSGFFKYQTEIKILRHISVR